MIELIKILYGLLNQQQQIQMKLSVQRQKLQLMHDALDRQLQLMNIPSNTTKFMKSSVDSEASINQKRPKLYSKDKDNKNHSTNSSRKQQINQLEKKLLQLQKKMQNIDVLDSEQDSDTNIKFKQLIRNSKFSHHEEHEENLSKNPQEKNPIEALEKYKKFGISKNKPQTILHLKIQTSSEQQDDEDKQFPTKIEKQILKKSNGQQAKESINNIQIARVQPIKSTQDQELNYLQQRYPSKRSRSVTKKSDKKERKLSNNKLSNQILPHSKRKSVDLSRQNSRKSLDSQRKSLNRSDIISKKCINYDLEDKKQLKRVNNLQQEVVHYKRMVKKLQQRIKDLQVIEIQHRKLQKNFAKSETIRKQQKKLIENLKKK